MESDSSNSGRQKTKEQWPHIAGWKVQIRYWETLSPTGVVQHWDMLPREVRGSLSWVVFEAQTKLQSTRYAVGDGPASRRFELQISTGPFQLACW